MKRAYLLTALVVVLSLSACTVAGGGSDPAGSIPQAGMPDSSEAEEGDHLHSAPAITVRSSGAAWVVRGTTLTGTNQYLVQCAGVTTAGSSALVRCDMSTSQQVVANKDGQFSVTQQPKAFVNVGSVSEVDCTRESCALAVANVADQVLAVAKAPLPESVELPQAPRLKLTHKRFGATRGHVMVMGEGFIPGEAVRLVQCPAVPGGVDGDSCLYDEGRRVVAASAGTVSTRLSVKREITLVGGGVVDCAVPGACVVAHAWTDGGRMALVDLRWGVRGGVRVASCVRASCNHTSFSSPDLRPSVG